MKHLAQAKGSRLSENSWYPVVVHFVVTQARDPTLSEEWSRSGEEVSPKREHANPIVRSVGSLA
ncbi:hypothetical protein DEO72_LG10g1348 [Vigna unguiculata]|uniref:Uncharacterized protein n=1 Tax=Vigna unguiculata TaxID=3917 RepID=A0A4D6NB69_VIGUN|nr:hypothetical protein DEO72_LG10g1348 [Vigna unguiculata]